MTHNHFQEISDRWYERQRSFAIDDDVRGIETKSTQIFSQNRKHFQINKGVIIYVPQNYNKTICKDKNNNT